MSVQKDRDGLLALMVGVVLITAVVLGVMAFAPLEPFSDQESWSYQEPVDLESLNLSVQADVCDVEVSFEDLDGSWMEVGMSADGRSGYIAGEPDINFTVSSSLDGGNLAVTVSMKMYTGPTVTYDESDILVIIDLSLLAYLQIDVDVGDVVITAPFNSTLTGAAVHTDVGGLHAHLEEGATVGDLDLRSDVGSVNLDSRNADFYEDTVVMAETGTGSIYLDLERSTPPEGNVTFDCLANVGSVYLTLDIVGDVSAEITSQANGGDIETELVGFSGMEVHLVSDNHPDQWSVVLLLEADVGSVSVHAEWRE